MGSTLGSVTQALRVLDALKERGEIGVTDISLMLDCAVSTAHRIATTLVASGYAEQVLGSKKYRLGPAMRKTTDEMDLALCIKAATPFMRKLRDLTEETVQLAVLEDSSIRFLAAFESERIMRVTSRVGAQMPAHTTAAGKLLLSYAEPAEVERLYAQGLPAPRTPSSVTSASSFKRLLIEARIDKYTISMGETESGVTAVAVAIERLDETPLCALTISGPANRFKPQGIEGKPSGQPTPLHLLQEAAQQISKALMNLK